MDELVRRYAEIDKRFQDLADFTEQDLEKSRKLFDFQNGVITPKYLDTWTFTVGLPLPDHVQAAFSKIITRVKDALPQNTRFYCVRSENRQWEVCVVKWPREHLASEQLKNAADLAKRATSQVESFAIDYRGFLITTEGTIIVRGFGDLQKLRAPLRQALPFASKQQPEIGHISIGRILDPVGPAAIRRLKAMVSSSQNEAYGTLLVSEVKYVHETKWYMEERELIRTLPLGGD